VNALCVRRRAARGRRGGRLPRGGGGTRREIVD